MGGLQLSEVWMQHAHRRCLLGSPQKHPRQMKAIEGYCRPYSVAWWWDSPY